MVFCHCPEKSQQKHMHFLSLSDSLTILDIRWHTDHDVPRFSLYQRVKKSNRGLILLQHWFCTISQPIDNFILLFVCAGLPILQFVSETSLVITICVCSFILLPMVYGCECNCGNYLVLSNSLFRV
jgi:hypothetical protein